MIMKISNKKVEQLIKEGILYPPIDGNHGEKHPKTMDYVSDGIPFILAQDLKDGTIDFKNCYHISESQARTLSKGFSQKDDVLLTHKGTIGRVAIVRTDEYPYIILTPQVTYYRVRNASILSNKYLYYYFLSKPFQNVFKLYASSGGTRDYLGIVAQQKLPVIFPEIHDQIKIVDVLEKYDQMIMNNNNRIKTIALMAENFYKEWFVRFRFPGYKNITFENGIPRDWHIGKIGDVGDVVGGGTPSTAISGYWNGSIPWLSPSDLVSFSDVFISSGKMFLSEEGLKHSSAQLLPKNTVLLSSRAPVGYVAIAKNALCTNQGFKSVICNQNIITPYYLYYFFKENKALLESYASGATFLELSATRLKKIKIVIPPLDLQKRFADLIESMFFLAETIVTQNKNLKKQRDLLLPRLLSGKLEVR